MTAARRLRELLGRDETLLVPGAYNALVARILEQEGFEALYTGGYAAAAANYGLPDIGIMTGTEMADHVSRIARAVPLPVIADADTGFGELTNVARTVREYERAGAAAVQIEDQTFPKRCGHMEGKRVIPRDEMVRKVRAALAARTNPDTVIVARTDAIAVTGLDDAIDRMQAYAEAGADLIFPDAPRSTDDLRAIAAAVDRPLVANFSEHGKTPLLSRDEVQELGYAIALYPTTTLFAAAHSARELAAALKADGTSREALGQLMVFDELNELLGLSRWQEEEGGAL
ncbi:MAG: isocitrate lyase/phosphoenolpyruvate mutase family protein [Gaiellales bacterium]